jgi:formylglycine-generating enzyme required for sulfatase activity/MinD-like ATPase involved in chromosome partitioning or flagellar assembly
MAERAKKGRIYTFYSYKGGVGRTMALANVAALMTKWGQRVLVIDWDLEAPGLEVFFNTKFSYLRGNRENKPGVVDLLYARADGKPLDWRDCLLEANIFQKSLWIISAGEKTSDYQRRVQHLNWGDLFERHNVGNYIDDLRNQWAREYDYVLVDSRTGITDIGDICTVLLPDALVLLFISNYQNIFGIKSVMERARKAHKKLPVNRSRLIGVPVPSRDEVYNEYDRSQKWKEIFAENLGEYYTDWLPRGVTPRDALNKLFIPYVANWSFGERLPVVENENEIHNPASISAAYSRLTRLLTSGLDWNEVSAASDSSELSQARVHAQEAKAEAEMAKHRTKRLMLWSLLAISVLVAVSLSLLYYHTRPTGIEKKSREAWEIIHKAKGEKASQGRTEALQYLKDQGISLAGVNLKRASLPQINLDRAALSGADLNEAILTKGSFLAADMTRADLRTADLERSKLNKAILMEAKLAGANLSGADLSGANLKKANLQDAQLGGAILHKADLSGADLSTAKGITVEQLSKATLSPDTKLPERIKNSIGMVFALIRPGTFLMGSPKDEIEARIARDNEPQHRVTLSKAFYLQTTEVTQEQWQKIMGNNPAAAWTGKECDLQCPVVNVNFENIQRFIEKLEHKERTKNYRLPWEAEWEYACRAGTTGRFYTGECISTDRANYNGVEEQLKGCAKRKGNGRPIRVRKLPPNPWSLYGMHGNVWEWCQDCYDDRYGISDKSEAIDPKGPKCPEGVSQRVLRGGCFASHARHIRSAYRINRPSNLESSDRYGFRLACDP